MTTATRRVRRLTAAERHIDAERIAARLDHETDRLERLIAEQIAKQAGPAVRGRARLDVTARMRSALAAIERAGETNARAEAASMGVAAPVDYALPQSARMLRIIAALQAALVGISAEMNRAAADELAATASTRSARKVAARISGARSAARGSTTRAYFAGHAALYDRAASVFPAWQYTAVLDGGTCPACRPLDGQVYPSWDAIQAVLPDGGPNPSCLGGNRCRCRAVPVPPTAGAGAAFAVAPNGAAVAAAASRVPVLEPTDAAVLLRRLNAAENGAAVNRAAARAAEHGATVSAARALLAVRDPDRVEPHPLGVAYVRRARGRVLRIVAATIRGRLVILHVEDLDAAAAGGAA